MDIVIKPMESDSEIRGKAYVHWNAGQDAYSGLVDPAYLDELTIEKCTDIAFRWLDNLLIAKENGRVIGFVGYGIYGDDPFMSGFLKGIASRLSPVPALSGDVQDSFGKSSAFAKTLCEASYGFPIPASGSPSGPDRPSDALPGRNGSRGRGSHSFPPPDSAPACSPCGGSLARLPCSPKAGDALPGLSPCARHAPPALLPPVP